ncbi:MAG: hypothetical protein Q8Q09_05690 [Deltaproteobacteria bacterium]|nr:hypothetical protein [Deltaproteobacteria bacterium]
MSAQVLRFVSVFLLLNALMGCDTGTQYNVRDTEQSVYRVSCREGVCREEISSPMGARPQGQAQPGEHAGFALLGAHVPTVCHAWIAEGRPARPDLSRCRPIACARDLDCPPMHRGQRVACGGGLCVARSPGVTARDRGLDRVSAAGLCMAGAGPTSQARMALTEDRLAFATASCDAQGQCEAPRGCRALPE